MPNKGMKLTKPGQLRSFAAYPRCWADIWRDIVTDVTEAELRAFLGPRADYYVAQWQGTARRATNWAAFLFSGLWLPFRRMYSVALIFYAAIGVESVLEQVVFSWLGYAEVPTIVERLAGLVFALVCGIWGNHWYFARVRRVVAETRALALPPDEHLAELTRRGGTRLSHALAFLLILVVALVALVILTTALQGA